jgi:hypothetical protein
LNGRFADICFASATGLTSEMNSSPKMEPVEVLRIKLGMLQQEHRDLDAAIAALDQAGRADPLTLRRLKKQKLSLKDRIARLADEITPDIIA